MERKLRRCAVCGNEYRFCPRCNEDKDKPLFYFTFCSENCRSIYCVTSEYENGRLSAINAKEQLDKLNLSRLDNFGTSYKSSIDKIMKSASVVSFDKVSDDVIDLTEVADIEKDIIHEDKNVKKPRNRKAKNDVE